MRNVRLRPYASSNSASWTAWFAHVGSDLRGVFLSRQEGLPQTLQRKFAQQWADFCGCKYALMLPHGTDALRLGLAAAFDHDGLEYGGEVIVPNLSFIASATCALDRRFGVVFVDVLPGTLNIDPHCVEAAIIPGKTRAIIPVHQFGQPADMTALKTIAERYDLKVIEDAAQAHGAEWETGKVGSLGDAGAFSFQSAKNLSCGEGGILTTNDQALVERADSLHNVGRAPGGGGRWEHESLGWNCRATEYQAALLLHRLKYFERQQATRAKNFIRLKTLLEDVSVVRPLETDPRVRQHGMYMFAMRFDSDACGGLGLEEFLKATSAEGLPIHRLYSSTLSDQPVMRKLAVRHPDYIRLTPTPVADRSASEIVYISANVFLGNSQDMDDIAAGLMKLQRHYSRDVDPKMSGTRISENNLALNAIRH